MSDHIEYGPEGLIPARAGKTRRLPTDAIVIEAHPRACGENASPPSATQEQFGSSPRVRGKPLGHHRAHERRRLIPARAGKTLSPISVPRAWWAHPRACGENPQPSSASARILGSSPRVRGKLTLVPEGGLGAGLIPARAGKPALLWRWGWSGRAHPRACGENLDAEREVLAAPGSSPRVRGKRALHSWVWGEASRPAVMRSMRSL